MRDRYAMKKEIGDETVGHVPIELSKPFYYFVKNAGTIKGEVMGKRQRSLTVGKGLEIPCKYIFTGTPQKGKKLKRLLQDKLSTHSQFAFTIEQ